MGRILSGLVRCGAWGCFDEFNRLDEATLSAISMYIQPIQLALKTNQSTLTLLNQEVCRNINAITKHHAIHHHPHTTDFKKYVVSICPNLFLKLHS